MKSESTVLAMFVGCTLLLVWLVVSYLRYIDMGNLNWVG